MLSKEGTFNLAIAPLIKMLSQTDKQKQSAALALAGIASCNEANSSLIAKADGIPPLVC